MLLGSAVFTVVYANAFSYLSDDPAACANCHVMRHEFDAWAKSAHRRSATCNDCHVPHDFVGHWYAKALNGYRHSSAFTLQNYPTTIRITPGDRDIVNANCRRCHEGLVSAIRGQPDNPHEDPDCIRCHARAGAGHGAR